MKSLTLTLCLLSPLSAWPAARAATVKRTVFVTHHIYSGRVSPSWKVKAPADQARILAAIKRALKGARRLPARKAAVVRCNMGAYLVDLGVRHVRAKPLAGTGGPVLTHYCVNPSGTIKFSVHRMHPRRGSYEVYAVSPARLKALRAFLARTRPAKP